MTAASNLIGTRPPDLPDRRTGPRGRGPALGRRRARDGPRLGGHRPARRRLLGVLAVQVPRAALRRARGRSRAARDAAPGQAAALGRGRARAVRARNAALRAARGDDRRGRLPRLARSHRRTRPATAGTALVAGMAAVHERTRRPCRARLETGAARHTRGERLQQRARPAHPDAAVHRRGPRPPGDPARASRSGASTPRPGTSTRSSAPATSGLGDTGGVRVGLAPYTQRRRRRPAAQRACTTSSRPHFAPTPGGRRHALLQSATAALREPPEGGRHEGGRDDHSVCRGGSGHRAVTSALARNRRRRSPPRELRVRMPR